MTIENSRTLTSLKGVGQALAQKLEKLDIESVSDLIFHLPANYQDRTRITPIAQMTPAKEALFCGQIESVNLAYGRRRSLTAVINDGSGRMVLRWFYFNKNQQSQLTEDAWISGFGAVRFSGRALEIIHPEYRVSRVKPHNITAENLTPIYPLTQGVSQTKMRDLVKQSFACLKELPDFLGIQPHLHEALKQVHFPIDKTTADALLARNSPAQKRLALEEFTAHHISLKRFRLQKKRKQSAAMDRSELTDKLLNSLPFSLTAAQQRVIGQISEELSRPITMQRLLQGDVGSGKTIVAAAAICQAIGSGYQAAFMAPTELLAEQHLATFNNWLAPYAINIVWLSGKLTRAQHQSALQKIISGQAQLVIGTHALFQQSVEFENLGLVVVDEQHRFGVGQRLALVDKAQSNLVPHQLAMTATPIPRTLAMIFYADMDVSVIDELPKGRKPIETVLISDARREQLIQRIAKACQEGRQAYWVCPLIEESEVIQAEAVTNRVQQLSEDLPKLRIEQINGRMKSEQKNAIMSDFRDHKIDLLVATTVIEVGVDVPNASLMIIENSERMGLAQLHQLRGRIGRGDIQSCCVLMYHPPLGEIAQQRLSVMRQTNDGFEIAKRDLELRGPGELLGTRQTGLQQLKIADLVKDQDLLQEAARLGDEILKLKPENAQGLVDRWVKNKERYADV